MELVFIQKGRHVCYLFPISCPLGAADRSTGEVLRANIRKNLNIPLLNEVLYAFPLDLPAATADRASANDRCEEARANEIGSPVLRLPCMAHVASTGQGYNNNDNDYGSYDMIIVMIMTMAKEGVSASSIRPSAASSQAVWHRHQQVAFRNCVLQ